MDTAYTSLVQQAAHWTPLSPTQSERLCAAFRPSSYGAGEHVLLPGSKRHEILFVAEGLLRFYYPGEGGKESNKAFVAEEEFAGALAAANLGLPVLYGVEALEQTHLLVATYDDFEQLMAADPVFERLGRKLAELILMRKELRTRSMLLHSASERYASFVHDHPDLVQRVPQYHIASLLGISEVHLSRLRRQESH